MRVWSFLDLRFLFSGIMDWGIGVVRGAEENSKEFADAPGRESVCLSVRAVRLSFVSVCHGLT
jgi:hypothetical protein